MPTDLSFRALRVSAKGEPGELIALGQRDLGDGDLLVRVTHSSLNFKDGLAVLGRPGVVRAFPMTCGIDLAGEVVEAAAGFSAGEEVVLTGAGLSETTGGGYSDFQRVDSTSVVPTPRGLGPWGAMAVGTAGLTAMLCAMRLEAAGINPERGPVVVTGATGGVGSLSVLVLSRLGYDVLAVTGKESEHPYLMSLGASQVLERSSLSSTPKPIDKERWAAGIDCVGGVTLANVLSHTRYGGAVAACGLAGGADLPTTVLPFILRNVSLLGVDSVNASLDARRTAWARLDALFEADELRSVAVDADLDDVPALSAEIVSGRVRGRVVISIQPRQAADRDSRGHHG